MAADPLISAIHDPLARELVEKARAIAENAYATRSHLLVGAAVRTATSATYTGCNVENDSFGLTICAERNAVAQAVAAEGAEMKIVAVGLYARSDTGQKPVTISPCGACRQVLAQFDTEGHSAPVTFLEQGVYTTKTVETLLPYPFELR